MNKFESFIWKHPVLGFLSTWVVVFCAFAPMVSCTESRADGNSTPDIIMERDSLSINGMRVSVVRRPVPGGWLYIATQNYGGCVACTFVPDPTVKVEKDR